MKVISGNKWTEIHNNKQDIIVLVSYSTPVCGIVHKNTNSPTAAKTNVKYSLTTTKHINNFLGRYGIKEIDTVQSDEKELTELLNEAKNS